VDYWNRLSQMLCWCFSVGLSVCLLKAVTLYYVAQRKSAQTSSVRRTSQQLQSTKSGKLQQHIKVCLTSHDCRGFPFVVFCVLFCNSLIRNFEALVCVWLICRTGLVLSM